MKKRISEVYPRLEAVLTPHRSIALDALTDIMMEALTEVGQVLNSELGPGDEGWDFDRMVCGFRPEQMENILSYAESENLIQWVSTMSEQDRLSLLMAFLNWDRMRMNDFRSRFPNSFTKWTPSDDEALLEMYGAGRSWQVMSEHFGRNINAVKLRLQHLGVDLGAESAHTRFPRRASADAQPQASSNDTVNP